VVNSVCMCRSQNMGKLELLMFHRQLTMMTTIDARSVEVKLLLAGTPARLI